VTYDNLIVALCLWREARSESTVAMQGVYWVIQNRVKDPRWPSTAAEVILQPRQFSSFLAGDPNATRFPNPKDKLDWVAWQRALAVVETPGADPTNGSNHYESCSEDAEPTWAKTRAVTHRAGDFEFYKL
jgi:N-acetylmuramoyl-L-alanine amidase